MYNWIRIITFQKSKNISSNDNHFYNFEASNTHRNFTTRIIIYPYLGLTLGKISKLFAFP